MESLPQLLQGFVEPLSLFLLGFGTAAYGAMVGAGGGFIFSPVLVFIGLEPAVAAGTSLALVTVTGISGTQVYRKSGLIDLRSGVLFAAAAMPGSVIAPFVVSMVSGSIFKILFGVLLVGLAVLMLVRPNPGEGGDGTDDAAADAAHGGRRIVAKDGRVFRYRFNEPAATVFNLVLGFISSFFGIAGGPIRTPVLVHFFNFPVRVAVATSLFALSFYGAAGAVVYMLLGHIELYPIFLWAGIGFIAGAQVGARLAERVAGSSLLRLLLVVLFALGVLLVVQGIRG